MELAQIDMHVDPTEMTVTYKIHPANTTFRLPDILKFKGDTYQVNHKSTSYEATFTSIVGTLIRYSTREDFRRFKRADVAARRKGLIR